MALGTVNADRFQIRRLVVHLARLAVFVSIIVLIHLQYAKSSARVTPIADLSVDQVDALFPAAATLVGVASDDGRMAVRDADGQSLGYVVQTSPQSDHIIGFSGPTNVLIGFDDQDRVVGFTILSSEDTRDHLLEVQQSERFMSSLDGKSRDEIGHGAVVDAVSGATLTSLAIQESIIHRLGGEVGSLRFPAPLTLDDVKRLFPNADHIEPDPVHASLWSVQSAGDPVGQVLRSSPAADNIVGYQGPTDVLIGLDRDGAVVGIAIGKSYDNEPYVGYVREDSYFRSTFDEMKLPEIAKADLYEMRVEGVSGATMTSMAVADGVVAAAEKHLAQIEREASRPKRRSEFQISVHDIGTGIVIIAAIVIGSTSLRANKRIRIAFQLTLIVYLGLIAGNLLSQAMIAGWAKHGVPLQMAPGLTMLAIAAFACPLLSKRNIYCSHLCPHGAVQQLIKGRIRYQIKLGHSVSKLLMLLPGLLLLWCLVVSMAALPMSLVDIEPFDAYVFRIAGWATIAVFVVGVVASLFIPMAYCRFGCPTGRLLDYLRFNARSDHWTVRDWVALSYLGLAIWLSTGH
ncbi:FMN-binding protein [Novipirellula caenicola]|uniref:Ion-translocating oxidoreductase complex subunit G n=1 Tax=Novipirellula caenicola TaxID=1536901 RepID=A0ABP9VUG1_9BACT